MKYISYGREYDVRFKINHYASNNSIYVGMDYYDSECNSWLPFANITTNIGTVFHDYNYVDTNNLPEIDKWLEENNFAKCTGLSVPSGFCEYPLMKFNIDAIENSIKESV